MLAGMLRHLRWLALALLLFGDGAAGAERPMVIAHRGAMVAAPENTLPALRKALELRADALEIDLQLTRDGELVLMHDRSVARTTDGRGRVGDYTLAELRRLDAGAHFGSAYAGTRVPTLDEVLALPRGDTWLIVELKETGRSAAVAELRLLQALRAHAARRIMLKSFSREQLARLRAAAPQYPQLYVMLAHFPLSGLTIARRPGFHDPLSEPVEWLQWHRWFVSRDRVRSAHAAGKKVVAWSVNDEADILAMIALGVDGIETDHPARVRRLRNLRARSVAGDRRR
jgi:glycerophosphoryl diester phosphodiesterase